MARDSGGNGSSGNGSGGNGQAGLVDQLPTGRLREELEHLASAYADRALDRVNEKVEELSGRLTDYAEHGGPGLAAAVTGGKSLLEGKSPVKGALSGAAAGVKEKFKQVFGKSKGGRGRGVKVVNIIENVDVGLPIRVTYNQWTQYQDFPSFMKKLESADQSEETKVNWKAQVFWSHRTWESTIIDQEPDDHIVWRSSGAKGYVNGAVTFHELTPTLTRILLVLEYHPQGLFERTGNIWRAQGRRARLELKHFRRHAMTQVILRPDDVEGWRGRIKDGEVVESHEDAVSAEQEESEQEETGQDGGEEQDSEQPESDQDRQDEDSEYDDEYSDEQADEGGEPEGDEADEEPLEDEDEYSDDYEEEDDQDSDADVDEDEDEDELEPAGRGRRR